MRKMGLVITVFSGMVIAVGTAGASDFWANVQLDFRRMNAWPQPFVQADRELVRHPLMAMTNNGWQLQNTLSDHFFRADDQSLTQAGEFKLRWILTQVPAHRRTVFVLRGTSPHLTSARMASVENYVRSLSDDGARAEVLVSDKAPAGGAGDYFDQVDRQLKASIPAPRLPARGGVSDLGS